MVLIKCKRQIRNNIKMTLALMFMNSDLIMQHLLYLFHKTIVRILNYIENK